MLMSSTSMSPVQLVARSVDLRWLRQWAPLPLRLIVGYGFIAHGYAKFSRGPETFAVVLHTIGTPIPLPLAWLTTLVEMIGGLAVMIGAFVSMVSLPMAVVLLTALFTIHLPYGFFSVKLVEVTASGTKFGSVGYEIILLYLAGLTALVLGGAGPLSIDRWRSRRRARTRFATRLSMGQSAACNREIGMLRKIMFDLFLSLVRGMTSAAMAILPNADARRSDLASRTSHLPVSSRQNNEAGDRDSL